MTIAQRWMPNACVVGTAPIAERDVEVAIWPKRNLTTVVIRLRLIHLQQDSLRFRIRLVRIHFRNTELGEMAGVIPSFRRLVPQGSTVVNEEAPVFVELWMEGQAQEPALIVGDVQPHHSLLKIQEGLVQPLPLRRQDPNRTSLIGDEQSPGSVTQRHQSDWRGEAIGHQLEAHAGSRDNRLRWRGVATDEQ